MSDQFETKLVQDRPQTSTLDEVAVPLVRVCFQDQFLDEQKGPQFGIRATHAVCTCTQRNTDTLSQT